MGSIWGSGLFGGGAGKINIKDEGVLIGDADTLNVVGSNFQATMTGADEATISLGTPPAGFQITAFTSDKSVVENGESVTAINFSWSYSPGDPDTSQGITPDVGPITPLSLRSILFNPSPAVTSSTVYTLTAVHGGTSYNASTTVQFRDRMFWGVDTNPDIVGGDNTITDIELNGLGFSSALVTSRQRTETFDATGGKYIYFLFPISFGTTSPELVVNTFPVTLSSKPQVTYTNQYGYSTTYYVYRTDNLMNGSSITVEVK